MNTNASYQANMSLSVTACRQQLKMHLLDAESVESDTDDHPL